MKNGTIDQKFSWRFMTVPIRVTGTTEQIKKVEAALRQKYNHARKMRIELMMRNLFGPEPSPDRPKIHFT